MEPPGEGARVNREALIFLHIPKTAGTTFHRIIESQYRPTRIFTINGLFVDWSIARFKRLPESRRARLEVLKGHMSFGLHEWLPQPSTYVTILRDPVDRVVSSFYYVQANYLHPLRREVVGKKMTLDDFVRAYPWKANTQAKFIAGLGKRDPCPPDTLERACANLRGHFRVAGLFERFEETLRLMSHLFGWKLTTYSRHRRGRNRPPHLDLPAKTIDLIRETNAMEVALCQFAAGRLEQQFAEHREAIDAIAMRDARSAGAPARWRYAASALARAAITQACSIF
jgi:sulfotransferase famil protein